jgi:D-alanyl-D-alanine carboxypeptidase (penicillin-binding protein 5/6)
MILMRARNPIAITKTLAGLLTGAIVLALAAPAAAQPSISSPHAILIDTKTGSVLFDRKSDEPLHPASMAKLMTLAVVFRELKSGKINLDTEYVVSTHAWRTGGAPSTGSKMFAALRSRIRIEDLVIGAAVVSGNDACIVLAEGLAGNEQAFAARMNAHARELGLMTARFRNPTGVHHAEQVISARDLGKLALHIVRAYPEYYKYFAIPELTWSKVRQNNRNPLLDTGIGVDGMKTGFIKESGYGIVASAEQDGQRLIVVVHGSRTEKERSDDAKRLLEWGFKGFGERLLFSANKPVAYAKVFGGESGTVPLIGKQDINLLAQQGSNDRLLARVYYDGPLRAPVAKGAEVAKLRVFRGDQMVLETPLYTGVGVPEGSIFGRAFDAATEFAGGLIRSAFRKVFSRSS